jgi:peptidoglycan/LPS O-acetylase OafA/YrhL
MERTIYFKGLNGIRAIASLIVVIWHTDQFSRLFNLSEIGFYTNGMDGHAVDIFFVLSGFLITYLLLVEKEKTKSIHLKNFYFRRILRIWPLYYLSVIISVILIYLGIVPKLSHLTSSIFLYTFLMANVAYLLNLAISSIMPLWSVGVEEQFYLIWPQIVKRTSKYLTVFIALFLLFLIIKLSIYLLLTPESILFKFLSITRIDIMSLGAIGAYLVYSKHRILKIIYRKDIQIISWLILIASIIYKPIHIFSFIDNELNAIFYLILILNVSSNKFSLISLETKFLNFIGKISYGIYVYHMIIIYLISFTLSSLEYEIDHFMLYPVVLIFTILTATLSYKYFETPFLSLKNKYAIVKSTDSKHDTV